MPFVQGSIVRGEYVPFPSIDRFPGEPSRVRLGPEGRLVRPEQHCPQKYFNFSEDGTINVLAPWLSVKPSTLFSPGFDPGDGVFAKQPIRKGDIVTEYGGTILNRGQVENLRKKKCDTHVKPLISWQWYFDSRWSNGYRRTARDPPPIGMYLNGHYLGGLMNSAYYQYDCNCEYYYQTCQPREDMPGLTHATRLFVRATEDIDVDEELLVHYGHDYFTKFNLPKVAQPRQP